MAIPRWTRVTRKTNCRVEEIGDTKIYQCIPKKNSKCTIYETSGRASAGRILIVSEEGNSLTVVETTKKTFCVCEPVDTIIKGRGTAKKKTTRRKKRIAKKKRAR